jgi:hypothetical protein
MISFFVTIAIVRRSLNRKKSSKPEKQHRTNAKPAIWHYLILFSTTINTFCLLSDKATNFCTSWGEKKIKNLKEKKRKSKPQATKINKEIEEGRKLEKMGKKFLLFV